MAKKDYYSNQEVNLKKLKRYDGAIQNWLCYNISKPTQFKRFYKDMIAIHLDRETESEKLLRMQLEKKGVIKNGDNDFSKNKDL